MLPARRKGYGISVLELYVRSRKFQVRCCALCGLRYPQGLATRSHSFRPAVTRSVRAAETFHAGAQRFALELADCVQVLVPFAPDSNLVCLALNPRGNTSVAAANAFVPK